MSRSVGETRLPVEVALNRLRRSILSVRSIVTRPGLPPRRAGRWPQATGTAQNRVVEGWFKRVYTPEGSAWLGNNSEGRVKPDVITHSIYYAKYGTYGSQADFTKGGWLYYDANDHLIYNANGWIVLGDTHDEVGFGGYTPESKNEQIKDILFNAVGWNY